MTPHDIDLRPVNEPPIVQSKTDEPWWKSKRLQGLALFIASSLLKQHGVIDDGVADIGKTIGGGWAGVGFYNAQNRATKIATATAKKVGVPVPPLKKG